MATTTNYGWTTPDDTALVKDGASAIRSLGSSVDTSVKALNPGTTAGDLDYYTAATTKARIAKGTANQVFAMNAGATAPEWQTISTGGMTLLSTTSLSGTSTTVSSISQAYTSLQVIVNNAYVNVANPLLIKINGGASIEASRVISGTAGTSSTVTSSPNDLPTTSGTSSHRLNLDQYANTSYAKPFYFSGAMPSGSSSTFMGGTYNNSTAVTSIVVTTVAGTATFTGGQILIYGVK
jgi:hypothetical protein